MLGADLLHLGQSPTWSRSQMLRILPGLHCINDQKDSPGNTEWWGHWQTLHYSFLDREKVVWKNHSGSALVPLALVLKGDTTLSSPQYQFAPNELASRSNRVDWTVTVVYLSLVRISRYRIQEGLFFHSNYCFCSILLLLLNHCSIVLLL